MGFEMSDYVCVMCVSVCVCVCVCLCVCVCVLSVADQERGERGQHRGGAGEPHGWAHPRRRRQLVRAAHRAAAGHPGRSAAGPQAWPEGVGRP